MDNIKASIVISSYRRADFIKKTLWSIALRSPSIPFEVVIVDETSSEDILSIVQSFGSKFPFQFIRFNLSEWEERTQVRKYWNCSAPCVNIGVKHARGELIYLMGNDVVAWGNVFDGLYGVYAESKEEFPIIMSETYNVPSDILTLAGEYGQAINQAMVNHCKKWPLQKTKTYESLVINYCSISSRKLWEKINYIDERYMGGISAEDSDFVRRSRVAGAKVIFTEHVSLHLDHGGKTMYRQPDPKNISQERFDEGCKINRSLYDNWDGKFLNDQGWPPGEYGVGEIITNY